MSERRESQRQDVEIGKVLLALTMFSALLLTLFINPIDPLLAPRLVWHAITSLDLRINDCRR